MRWLDTVPIEVMLLLGRMQAGEPNGREPAGNAEGLAKGLLACKQYRLACVHIQYKFKHS